MDRPLNFSPKQQQQVKELLGTLKHSDAPDDKAVGLFGKRLVILDDTTTPYLNERWSQRLRDTLGIDTLGIYNRTITLGDLRGRIKQVEPTRYVGKDQSAAAASPQKTHREPANTIGKNLREQFSLPENDVIILEQLFPNPEDHDKGQFAAGLWLDCCEQTGQPLPSGFFLMALNKHKLLDTKRLQTLLFDTKYKDQARFQKTMSPVFRTVFLLSSKLMPLSDAAKQELKDESLWQDQNLYARLDKLKCFNTLQQQIRAASPDTRISDACFKLLLSNIDTDEIARQVNAIPKNASTEHTVSALNNISNKKMQGVQFQPAAEESPKVVEKDAPDDENLICPLTKRKFKEGQIQQYKFYLDHIASEVCDKAEEIAVAVAIPMPDSDVETADQWSDLLEENAKLKQAFSKATEKGMFGNFKDFDAFIERLHQKYAAHWRPSELEKDIDVVVTVSADNVRNEQESLTSLKSLAPSLKFPKISEQELRKIMGKTMDDIIGIWRKQAKDLPIDMDFSNGVDCVLPAPEQNEHIPFNSNYTGILSLDKTGRAIQKVRKSQSPPAPSSDVTLYLRDPNIKSQADSASVSTENQATEPAKPTCYWLYSFPETDIRFYQKFHEKIQTGSDSRALTYARLGKGVVIQLFPDDDELPLNP